jgi:two-component system sensor histidine kinase KdpD
VPAFRAIGGQLRGSLLALALTALMTVILIGPVQSAQLRHITTVYLVPVLLAAIRWGIVPAITAAVAGVAVSAFFFYPPLFDLRVTDPQQILDLALFVCVAVVTGQLATNLKKQAEMSRRREADIRDLYDFSRRLAAAFAASEIYAAIQEHLARVLDRRVVLFEKATGGGLKPSDGAVPHTVRGRAAELAARQVSPTAAEIFTDEGGNAWLIRALSTKSPEFGMIAIDLGLPSQDARDTLVQRVDAVLAEAATTLDRLDIARALAEARMRSETEVLRDALIGSVSHELRTPLSSILGAATVLATAPTLASQPRLAELVRVIREEAERLNEDIQRLLDATRISSRGVHPREEWVDPSDIVNAAVDHCRRRSGSDRINIDVAGDVPLVYADPVLVEQALVQILDNAVKYSSGDAAIHVRVRALYDHLAFSVRDRGRGLTEEDKARMWERFYRGRRHAATIGGSGLGLWIAQAFVAANGGRISATSDGEDRGTTIIVELPLTRAAAPRLETVDE